MTRGTSFACCAALTAVSAWAIITQPASVLDLNTKCGVAGAALAAWLVWTPPRDGDPALTRWLLRSRIFPLLLVAAEGLFLLRAPVTQQVKTASVWFLLPPLLLLAKLQPLSRGR